MEEYIDANHGFLNGCKSLQPITRHDTTTNSYPIRWNRLHGSVDSTGQIYKKTNEEKWK